MRQVCPRCQRRYADDIARCPDDDTPLRVDPFIGVRIDRWILTDFVGQGAMGVVYAAEPTAAIKILNARRALMQPDLIRRFEIEAEAATRMQSPHIARVFASGTTDDGHLYIAMELLRGEPLDAILERSPRLPAATAVTIAHQIARALDEAHRRQVVHRDLKPANIFVEPAPGGGRHVRVLDFGVARINSESVARSRTGSVAGTPAYMSPEQLRGEPDIDGRSDIYSLGVVLYRLLAGHNPFRGPGGVMDTLRRHLEYVPPPPPDAPPLLAGVLGRLLAKSRDERPPTMADVTRLLELTGLVGGGGEAQTIPGISREVLAAVGLYGVAPDPEEAPVEPGLRFVGGADAAPSGPPAPPTPTPTPSPPPRPSPSVTSGSRPLPATITHAPPRSGRGVLWLVAGLVGLGAVVGVALIVALDDASAPGPEAAVASEPGERVTLNTAPDPPASDPTLALRAAEALLTEERWQAARSAFDAILIEHPEQPAARAGRSRALREASNEVLLGELTALVGRERWVDALDRLDAFPDDSVYAARAGAHRAAIERGWVEVEERAARRSIDEGAFEEAQTRIDALAARPAGAEAAKSLAGAVEAAQKAREKRRARREAKPEPEGAPSEVLAPASPDGYDELSAAALKAMMRGDREAAITLWHRASRDRPRSHVPHQRLCGLYKAKQDYRKALGACQKWLDREPNASYRPAIERIMAQLRELINR